MGKIIKIIGIITLIFVFALMTVSYMVSSSHSDSISIQAEANVKAEAYVKKVFPEIVKEWNAEKLIEQSTPELLKETSKEKLQELFQILSKLGALKTIGNVECPVHVGWYKSTGYIDVGTCQWVADFSAGKSQVNIEVIYTRNSWKINEFRLNWDVLSKTR